MRRIFNATTGTRGEQGRAPGSSSLDAPVLDAIAAYDLVAPGYAELSERRRAYLEAVDVEILRRVPGGAASLIDVGAGDGCRALQIAKQAGITRVVLVEPSEGMKKLIPPGVEVWNERVEALRETSQRFDLVLCLWNVLGHVASREWRVEALRNLTRVRSAGGLIFLDVMNRYNVAECGVGVVLRRLLFSHDGDVPVTWRTDAGDVETRGHVFSAREMEELFREAELEMVERIVLNYRTGRPTSWAAAGNLLYVLKAGTR